jgi:hypothetical protein
VDNNREKPAGKKLSEVEGKARDKTQRETRHTGVKDTTQEI